MVKAVRTTMALLVAPLVGSCVFGLITLSLFSHAFIAIIFCAYAIFIAVGLPAYLFFENRLKTYTHYFLGGALVASIPIGTIVFICFLVPTIRNMQSSFLYTDASSALTSSFLVLALSSLSAGVSGLCFRFLSQKK